MSTKKQLFGTDGIRGVANQYPITPEMAMKTGRAVAHYVKARGDRAIVIGRDTRLSGEMLESALAAGIASVGIDARVVGIIPTPGVAFLASQIEGIGAGIVISASHNPWQDNGIKLFKKGGHKLSDDEELALESFILDERGEPLEKSEDGILQSDFPRTSSSSRFETGRILPLPDAHEWYAHFLKQGIEHLSLKKPLKLVVDCSNGAASGLALSVFTPPLFDAHFIHCTPDGKNINDDCGSQHTETLKKMVIENGADLGIAFDGDADRLIAIDETGRLVTGDALLLICAIHAKAKGTLENNRVVSTVMSNIGLVRALKKLEIEHRITGVGDREVLKEMAESGAVMGGEDSGHMIFSQYHTTGDGILSALRLIEVMVESGKALSELASAMKVYPQVLMNVAVNSSRPDFMAVPEIADAIGSVENALGDEGRVLVRYSGTQPLLRVMVEGPDHEITKVSCQKICDAIRCTIAGGAY